MQINLGGRNNTCSAIVMPDETDVSVSKAQIDYLGADIIKLPLFTPL